MVTIVVVINILISLTLLYCTWQMCKLRRKLVRLTAFFTNCDRNSYAMLHRRPEAIYLGIENLKNLRQSNQSLQVKLRQIKQLLALIIFGRQILWNRPGFNLTSKYLKKKL
ncbi:hypothetical protein IQ247_24135 [Plectonema cf. radiosum LEGE 06105]|uniref:Uncharacterized protein n=1 Tax=Plectonema cf. radiosum LEGE 06105 TaxID=945769 RepID=A0A8J7F5Y3_9CYAN|nr:hypothetical protein [Plectonema radiosum]MBE9215717.1 hypothetical protein [Plectonema cf. radiosum LEGE 06105]